MSERIALLKSALKNKSKETVPSSSSSVDYGTLSASELEAQIRAAEAEEVLVLLVGVLAAAVLTLGGWRKPSGKLWGAAVLASLALYLLAIAWTLWSVVDGLLWPPR